MHKIIKLRVYPNEAQTLIIEQTLGTLRFLYNKYLEFNILQYQKYTEGETDISFYGANAFYREIYSKKLKFDEPWIPETSNKAARQGVIREAERAFTNFFKNKHYGYPKFKSKRKNPVRSYFFVKEGVRFDRPRMIWIPVLHYLEFKDNGYYKKNLLNGNLNVTSGRIVKDPYGRYFVSLVVEYDIDQDEDFEYGIRGFGIDLGLRKYATIYDGIHTFTVRHPWKSNTKLRFYEEQIKTYQRLISMKIEINKTKEVDKDRIYNTRNIQKLRVKMVKYYKRIHDYMDDFINKLCSTLLRAKPEWIMVEELVVKDLLETDLTTHEHHDIVQKSNWYKFRETLTKMAVNKHCTVYEVPKYYPSSKKCHLCGHKNKTNFKDEIIKCKKCGEKYDRDVNAAINLYNYKKSKASVLEVDFVVD